jgi:nucleotide-binding universal stress UspA family protein
MRTILLPVDGTARSDAAVQCVIRQALLGQIGTVHLVNVQPRLGSYIGRFLKAALVQDFYREQGEKALHRSKQLLDEAGIPYQPHIYAGDIVETIARAAKELGVDEIVMSANNLGIVGSLDLHSVVGRVLRRVSVPVSVVN